jgi:four helix bundle protein
MDKANIKTFEDLKVWQKGIELTSLVYKITQSFPPEEKYALANQLRRASVSVPSNIAEGYGRRTSSEFKRFLSISLGSVYEIQTQLRIGFELNFIPLEKFVQAKEMSIEIDRMIYAIIKKIN